MDHVKQLELDMLLKFKEAGGIIKHRDFDKVFSDNPSMWRAIYDGLKNDEYCSYGQYSMQNNEVGSAYGIEPKGYVRIIQLQKEKDDEEADKHEGKEVSGWTKWGAIRAWVAAGLTLIGIIVTIYLSYYPPKSNYIISDPLPPIQIDSNAFKTDSDTVKVIGADGKPVVYPKEEQYQTFELSHDINPVIVKGEMGVILEIFVPDKAFEVEFPKENGYNYEYEGQGC